MREWHRGWLILFVTVLTLLACLGLGRFSLGAMIPFMKDGLSLNYSETGWIASSVFVGYLVMVAVAGHLVMRFTAKKVIVFSLFLISLGMLGNANASGFWSAYFSCLFVGLGSGGANIPALGLLAGWFAPHKRGMAMGIAYAGTGLGFVFSGLIIPSMVTLDPSEGWRSSWYILALFIFVIAFIHLLFLKNNPQEMGLQPIGVEAVKQELNSPKKNTNATKKDTNTNDPTAVNQEESVYRHKTLWFIGGIYLTWGFSYIIFSTFLVDYLMEDLGFEKSLAGQYFSVVGLFSIISGFIWGSVSDRLGRPLTLSMVYALQGLLLITIALSTHALLILIEIILFSVTLWAVPTIMVAAVGDFIDSRQVSVAMGFITLFFGVGQFISPIVNGYLLDISDTYFSAFIVSSSICLLGAMGCLWLYYKQKKRVITNENTA